MNSATTEVRIFHKTEEIKTAFEAILDKALETEGYRSRDEWISTKATELIRNAQENKGIPEELLIKYLDALRKEKLLRMNEGENYELNT